MKFTKALCTLFFFVSAWTAVSQHNIVINHDRGAFIGQDIEYVVDTTHRLTIDQVTAQTFTQGQLPILNFGNTPHPVWMRFGLSSETETELYLEVMAPLLNNLEVYAMDSMGAEVIFKGGFLERHGARPIHLEDWLIPLKVNKDIRTTFYLRCQSIYPLQVPIQVSSKDRFIEQNQKHNLFWGIYIGVMIFAFVYNLFIYLSVKERTYLFYLLYILGSATFYLGLQGYAFQYLWPNVPAFNPHIPIIICLTNIVITLFTFRFLQITRQQKVSFYWGLGVIVVFSLIPIL